MCSYNTILVPVTQRRYVLYPMDESLSFDSCNTSSSFASDRGGKKSLASISQQQSAQHDSVSMQLNTVEEQLSLLLASDWFTVMIGVAVASWRTQCQELMRLKPQMFSEKLFIICIASCVSNTNRRSLGTVVV